MESATEYAEHAEQFAAEYAEYAGRIGNVKCFLFAAAGLWTVATPAFAQRPMTIQDLLGAVRIADPQWHEGVFNWLRKYLAN